MMIIYLIRHGRTLANEKKLYCGCTDLPLSREGASDILKLKQQNIYPTDIDLFFTSGMHRADETLHLLYGHVDKRVLPELAEYNFGDFEMKCYEDLKNQKDYQAWIEDDTGGIACPGGESRQEFAKRVLTGFGKLQDSSEQRIPPSGENSREKISILTVCHGGVIVSIMDHLFPNTRNFYEWQPEPGRGHSLKYTTDGILTEPI